MNVYHAPEWMRIRRISDAEYARWLDDRAKYILDREKKAGKTAFDKPEQLKLELHRVAHASSGRDPYSNARFFVKHIRSGWVDGQKHLKGNRHYQTLRRCMPSFDHVVGMGHRKYELCTRETNSAKSFMSPAQFVDLCARVTRHQAGGIQSAPAPVPIRPAPDAAPRTALG